MKKIVLMLFFWMLSSNAFSAWSLNKDLSTLSFVSTKKGNIAEVHTFRKMHGEIADNGDLSVSIDLASVDTNIPVRDERMKQFLFEVVEFPKAVISATVHAEGLRSHAPGHIGLRTFSGTLEMHGQSQTFDVAVACTKISDSRVMITATRPVIVDTKNFDMVEGVEKLRELAGLPSISTTSPVTFVFVFDEAE